MQHLYRFVLSELPASAMRTVMPSSEMPAWRQAPSAAATCWNAHLASPWMTTVGLVSGVRAAARSSCEFCFGQWLAIEIEVAVGGHGYDQRQVWWRIFACLGDFRHRDLNVAIHLIELRGHHEENDEQEQHVDHRREVQRWHVVVMMKLEWQWEGRVVEIDEYVPLSGCFSACDCEAAAFAVFEAFVGNEIYEFLAVVIDFHDEAVHASYEEQVEDQ